MFSDRFEELCAARGVKPGRACQEMGLSRSLAAKWKSTGTEKPSADALEKMSAYFGMTIDEILDKEKAPAGEDERTITENDIKAAFWGGEKDLSAEEIDDLWEDARSYIAYKTEQMKKKRRM